MELRDRYLDTLKLSLIDIATRDRPSAVIDPVDFAEGTRPEWFDHFWFGNTLTMCGQVKLDSVRHCVEACLQANIPGDLVECGVWRGGVAIWMRGLLAAHGVADRRVWVVDSFQGLPTPPTDSLDARMHALPQLVTADHFAVPYDIVQRNFERLGLLDEQVAFLPGWFEETLPTAPIDQIALLRVDGDYYDSTWTVLEQLYPKVVPGGYIILDDWGLNEICGEQQATVDYRAAHGITDPIIPVDWQSAYWIKSGDSHVAR